MARVILFLQFSEGDYIYICVKDGMVVKDYNSKIESFAFANADIKLHRNRYLLLLYAYEEEKDIQKITGGNASKS